MNILKLCPRNLLLIGLVLSTSSGLFPVSAQEKGPSRSWDRYREIADLNIFSRNRRARSRSFGNPDDVEAAIKKRIEEAQAREASRGPADPGRDFVLFGVSKVGDHYYAFFDNTRESTIAHAAIGETIGNRKLTTISLDSVEYEAGGKPVTIAMGMSLAGERVERVARGDTSRSSGSSESSESKSETASSSESTPDSEQKTGEAKSGSKSSTGSESALERLLRRRREEMAK